MRVTAAFFACLLCSSAALSQGTSSLAVHISGAKPNEGQVLVALFNSKDSYMRNPFAKTRAKVDGAGRASVRFEGLVPGVYALSVIYDINHNGQLDTGLFGIPKEEFGFSNNAKGRLGPAKWEAARFTIEGRLLEQKISLTRARP